MAAADEAELAQMVTTSLTIDDAPSAFRFPRGEGTGVAIPPRGMALEIGKGRILREGSDVALLSLGTTFYFAEGYTGPGFDQYLTIQNPGATPATGCVRFEGRPQPCHSEASAEESGLPALRGAERHQTHACAQDQILR